MEIPTVINGRSVRISVPEGAVLGDLAQLTQMEMQISPDQELVVAKNGKPCVVSQDHILCPDDVAVWRQKD